MFGLGAQEMLLLAILGVILFGKRLPEVGRSLGKTVMEFKNGLRGMEDEFATAFRDTPDSTPARPQTITPPVPEVTVQEVAKESAPTQPTT